MYFDGIYILCFVNPLITLHSLNMFHYVKINLCPKVALLNEWVYQQTDLSVCFPAFKFENHCRA